jgi:hypothetical protein
LQKITNFPASIKLEEHLTLCKTETNLFANDSAPFYDLSLFYDAKCKEFCDGEETGSVFVE